jgi:DNA replication and repair protein RecF
VTLLSFAARDFRCLESVSLELSPQYNLVDGQNASGKTSLLEAIAYLGRGKSFRGAGTDRLVRHGADAFVLFGRVGVGDHQRSLGVRNSEAGLETSVDGERGGGMAALAELLPLQVMDPDVHALVAGGPDGRRRYLDWLAFHVEPGYLALWRDYRRALRQRNAILRDGGAAETLSGWDREFAGLAERVDAARVRMLETARPTLEATGQRLLGGSVGFDYQRGWPADQALEDALRAGRARDRQLGSTQAGPQRADLRISSEERGARKVVSRGQQKLLACTLILAATRVVQRQLERPLLLLLDDPAAELDAGSLGRLMAEVVTLESQVIATSLQADVALFPEAPARFHVEQGRLQSVD